MNAVVIPFPDLYVTRGIPATTCTLTQGWTALLPKIKRCCSPPQAKHDMIATETTSESERAREANPWRPVKHCQTIEDARAQLEKLRGEGVESSLLMDDGITVIAQRR